MAAHLVSVKSTDVEPSKATLSVMSLVSAWDPASEAAMPDVTATALVDIRATLVPATREAAAVELMQTLAGFEPPRGNVKAHTTACIEVLEDVPLDIIRAGLKRVRAECTFTPMAAEIRARVVKELNERRRLVDKAKVAADMAARRRVEAPSRRPTDEEVRRVSEMVASVKIKPRSNPLLECGPDRPPVETAVALRKVAEQRGAFRLPDESDPAVQRWLRQA